MKILHIIASLSSHHGGTSKACFDMAKIVASLGHQVTIYTTNSDGSIILDVPLDKPVIKEGVKIKYFPVQHPYFWRISIPLAKALCKEICKYDIVHIHSLYLFPNIIAGYFCRKYNIPYLITPHGVLDPYIYKHHRFRKRIIELFFENKNLKHAAAIHYTTEEEKRLAKLYKLSKPSVIIPCVIDSKDFENLPEQGKFRSKYPELLNKKIILFFSRINFKKGLNILVQAFAKITKIRNDVHLIVAGPDNESYGKKVKHWLKKAGVLDKTTFTGMLLGKDKKAILRDADVFVLPSYSENFGIAVVEAMACGLPVIISDKVNIWQEVKDADAGLISPCNVELFAENILDLLNDPKSAKQIGQNGKKLVKERFQLSSIAITLQDVYLSILQKRFKK